MVYLWIRQLLVKLCRNCKPKLKMMLVPEKNTIQKQVNQQAGANTTAKPMIAVVNRNSATAAIFHLKVKFKIF